MARPKLYVDSERGYWLRVGKRVWWFDYKAQRFRRSFVLG